MSKQSEHLFIMHVVRHRATPVLTNPQNRVVVIDFGERTYNFTEQGIEVTGSTFRYFRGNGFQFAINVDACENDVSISIPENVSINRYGAGNRHSNTITIGGNTGG